MVRMAAPRPAVHPAGMTQAQSFQAVTAEEDAVPSRKDTLAPARMLLGAAEFATYERELARLRDLRDRKLPERLRAARGFVAADVAEEIAHIQEQQTVMDARIARLVDLLGAATVIADDQRSDVATLGSTVDVEYPRTARRARYRLTGAASGHERGGVSARSPVGRALMGRRVGDVVSAELPGGRVEQLHVVSLGAARADRS
jgi:transcription elongation factor GreA